MFFGTPGTFSYIATFQSINSIDFYILCDRFSRSTFCLGYPVQFLVDPKYRLLKKIAQHLRNSNEIHDFSNKGRFCNTITLVALVHTSIQSD